jgi:hypothetical protein
VRVGVAVAGVVAVCSMAAVAHARPAARANVNVVLAAEQSCEYTVVGSAYGDARYLRGTAYLEVRLGGKYVRAGKSPLLPNGWFVITGGPNQDRCFADKDPKRGRFRVRFVGAKGYPSGLSRSFVVTCELLGYNRSCKPRAVQP